jgi:hypothetical protein
MSPKSVQRFWDNDMHKNKDLKPPSGNLSLHQKFSLKAAPIQF